MDAADLRSKANRCRYLADIATNFDIRQALDELAQELEAEAAAMEAAERAAGAAAEDGPANS